MGKNILIVPYWERETEGRLRKLIDSEGLNPIHIEEEFKVGGTASVNTGIEKLQEIYTGAAIREAKRKTPRGSNLAILYNSRGYGWMGVTAHYYSI